MKNKMRTIYILAIVSIVEICVTKSMGYSVALWVLYGLWRIAKGIYIDIEN